MDGLETTEMLGTMSLVNLSSVNLVFYVGLQSILVAEAVSEEVFRRSSMHQTPGLRTQPASYVVRGEMHV